MTGNTCFGYGTHLFNDGWEFAKFPLGSTIQEITEETEVFRPVGLPHDWLIYQGSNLYEDGTGWYRRYLRLPEAGGGKRYILRFEGVYMDSAVYVNGEAAMRWKYGYSTFEADITPFLKTGTNEILVEVTYRSPNSRWYTGAGIYRDVWLKVLHPACLVSDGTYVTTRRKDGKLWTIEGSTEVKGVSGPEIYKAAWYLCRMEDSALNRKGLRGPWRKLYEAPLESCRGVTAVTFAAEVTDPSIWDIACPFRYELKAVLFCGDEVWQEECYTIGFRRIEYSPDHGFFLNGRKVKLNGVNEHHDLGCLGAAYNSCAMRRKMGILKQMGVNALRLAHNMHAPDVMELADELGFLIVSEAFDTWELSKNRYDYARFFKEWYKKDVSSWVRRDRNHPCVILWSIGNEIYDTHKGERGREMAQALAREVRKHDPSKHAAVTLCSNYMPWENAQECAKLVDAVGYNYGEKYYEAHHKEHPDWVIFGSETGATVQSRGVYHFPYRRPMLAAEDLQCSSLGNSSTSWGAKSPEACILTERDHEFSCGQFLWSGFDYLGEPTPYHTRNSYMGQIDTAGFPKDSYYIYQAEWTDYEEKPMVHVFPYWDFNEGQPVDVRVCSNAPKVELFLNGKSLGTYEIDHSHGTQLTGNWRIPYERGELMAHACDGEGKTIAQQSRHSFGEAEKIVLYTEQKALNGDGSDLLFLEISAEDSEGYPVENACVRVTVKVSGAGRLAGLDNGDSTDPDEYKTDSRRLFNGKLLAVIAAGAPAGEVAVTVSAEGLQGANFRIPIAPCPSSGGTSRMAYAVPPGLPAPAREIPARALRLHCKGGRVLSPDNASATVTASVLPINADHKEVQWRAVSDAGIKSDLVRVKPLGLAAVLEAVSDGDFKLRCTSTSGTDHVRIMSELDFTVRGFGKAWFNPYSFISGGLYQYSNGNASNGNEHGVATARDGETQVGFSGLDFGSFGSDVITIPIFALTDEPYRIEIWEGRPGEDGGRLAGDVIYQRPSAWNVYQEETFHLNRRLSGVTDICFVLRQKIHMKGFVFKRLEKACEKLTAADCEAVYGDQFARRGDAIINIGNNVTLSFGVTDFKSPGADSLTVCGYTPLEKNTIQLRFVSGDGERTELLEFRSCGKTKEEQTFSIEPVSGQWTVAFVFLPGCRFDFYWLQFHSRKK